MDKILKDHCQRKLKTSISVQEMRELLGLGKTTSYWLVNKGYFKTIIAAGKMRVMIDSFEEWYAGQNHYKIVKDIGGVNDGINS